MQRGFIIVSCIFRSHPRKCSGLTAGCAHRSLLQSWGTQQGCQELNLGSLQARKYSSHCPSSLSWDILDKRMFWNQMVVKAIQYWEDSESHSDKAMKSGDTVSQQSYQVRRVIYHSYLTMKPVHATSGPHTEHDFINTNCAVICQQLRPCKWFAYRLGHCIHRLNFFFKYPKNFLRKKGRAAGKTVQS